MQKAIVFILILSSHFCLSCTPKSPEINIQVDAWPEFLETRYFNDHMEWARLSDQKKLNLIFSDYYDIEIVKDLLGDYLRNFLETFQSTRVVEISGNIIIEGFIPGGNRFTNGVVKIEEISISILFGYIENNRGLYMYFTNGLNDILPVEFYNWNNFPGSGNIEIRKM